MQLVLDEIEFSYNRGLPTEKRVLERLSLRVKQGEFLSILGSTGSGKTTLGLIMAGLLRPDAGEVRFEAYLRNAGASPRQHARGPKGTDVVMVFQFPESQFFEEDVFGEVAFGPSRFGLRGEELHRRVNFAMEQVRLDVGSLSKRSPFELSEGEKRKVAMASALSCRPRFLVLDEPAVSLDWEATVHIFEILLELRGSGVSIVVVTHDVENALYYSDTVGVLVDGRIGALGSPGLEELYGHLEAR